MNTMTKPLEHHRDLPFMCLLAFGVGIIAGLGAWGFRMLIGLVHNILFLGKFQFYYDANLHTIGDPWGPWVIFVPVIGAMVVAWLVKTFAPEAKGHGVPEVMDAIYYNNSKIRPVVGLIKAAASAVCIGSGGSVGREGPIITGAVMILEMTQDSDVVLPIMITTSFAYGIRKWLSPGSIYTLKLLRRGHIVPEGLQSAMSESRMARDAMVKGYSILEVDADVTPSEVPTLVISGDSIVGVIPAHTGGSTAQALAVDQYIMTPEKNSINDLLRQMDNTGSRFALVTGTQESTRPHEIIGIVTEREVAACAMEEAKLR